jgi:hypothetical protein
VRAEHTVGNPTLFGGFEVFAVVTMKNVVFWDIKTQFVLHKRYISLRYRVQPVNAM